MVRDHLGRPVGRVLSAHVDHEGLLIQVSLEDPALLVFLADLKRHEHPAPHAVRRYRALLADHEDQESPSP